MLSFAEERSWNRLRPISPAIFLCDSPDIGIRHRPIVVTDDEQVFVRLGNVSARERIAEFGHKSDLGLKQFLSGLGERIGSIGWFVNRTLPEQSVDCIIQVIFHGRFVES